MAQARTVALGRLHEPESCYLAQVVGIVPGAAEAPGQRVGDAQMRQGKVPEGLR